MQNLIIHCANQTLGLEGKVDSRIDILHESKEVWKCSLYILLLLFKMIDRTVLRYLHAGLRESARHILYKF